MPCVELQRILLNSHFLVLKVELDQSCSRMRDRKSILGVNSKSRVVLFNVQVL